MPLVSALETKPECETSNGDSGRSALKRGDYKITNEGERAEKVSGIAALCHPAIVSPGTVRPGGGWVLNGRKLSRINHSIVLFLVQKSTTTSPDVL